MSKKNYLKFAAPLVIAVALFSCKTTDLETQNAPAVSEDSQKTVPETPKEEQKQKKEKPKKTYTKMNFLEDLQNALNESSPEEVLPLFETKLPSQFKDDFDILYLKASLYVSAKQFDEATEICNILFERAPDNTDVIALAATIAKFKGDKTERTKQINALLAQDKMNPQANIELGEDAFNRKNYKLALQYYKRALVKEPYNIDALWGVGQTDYFMERDDEAKDFFKKILELDPQNAHAYSYLAKLAYAHDEHKIASDYIKKAIEIDPDNYEFHLNSGTYERSQGHFADAETEWTKAIEIDDTYFLAFAYRGGLYDETDQFDKALADYLKVIKLNPEYYYAYESIGVLALHEKNWKTAREAFTKCRNYNKDNISYPLMITYCYYMEDNPAEAKKYSDAVLRKMPDRESIEYRLLRVFHDKAGEKPIPQKIASITSRNKRGKMYYYFALYCDMLGATELAMEYYTKVVEMNSPMFFEYRLAEWAVK